MNTNNNAIRPISDLLSAISEGLDAADILSGKLESQISLALMNERIARKMTQSEFAELLGVKQSQISKWEAEDYNFTVEKLAKITTALDLKLNITMEKDEPLSSNDEKNCVWLQFPSKHWTAKSNKTSESEYGRWEM